jgi:hypothetical protein
MQPLEADGTKKGGWQAPLRGYLEILRPRKGEGFRIAE